MQSLLNFADEIVHEPPRSSSNGFEEPDCMHRAVQLGGGSDGVVAAREELIALEEKMTMQLLRLQQQSEHFMDIMLRPLEAKVASLEERQPCLEARVGELLGGIQGLEGIAEASAQRSEAMEARFRRWRKLLEEDLGKKQAELRSELSHSLKAERGEGYVTRDEMVDVVDLMKQELRHLVDSAMPRERELILQTRQDMTKLSTELQAQVAEVKAQVKSTEPAQRDITQAAEALRAELRRLSEQKSAAKAGEESQAEQDLQRCRGELAELAQLVRVQASGLEDTQRDLKHARGEVAGLKAREAGLDAVTRPEASRLAELAFERLWHERERGLALRSCRGSPASGGWEARRFEAGMLDGVAEEPGAAEASRFEAMALMVEAANMRLDALEERQRSWRHEAAEQDVDGRLERTWKIVEEEASLRVRLQRSLEELASRVTALERGRTSDPSSSDDGREFKVEISEVWRAIAELAENLSTKSVEDEGALDEPPAELRQPAAGSE